MSKPDMVNHPPHYTQHPSGVDCITITEHQSFCIGNAMKYLWRADLKNGLEDLKKAKWYIEREIARREKLAATPSPEAVGVSIDNKTNGFTIRDGDYIDRQQLDISQVVKFVDKCIESGWGKGEYLQYIQESDTLRYVGIIYGAIHYAGDADGMFTSDRTKDWLKHLSSK